MRWSLEMLDGTALADGETSLQAAALTTTHIDTFDLAGRVTDDNRRHLIFIAELWQDGRAVARQTAYFAPTKHLELVDPQVRSTCFIDAGRLHVELRAVRWPGWWSFRSTGQTASSLITTSICPPGGRLPSWSRCRRAGRNRKPQKRCGFVLFSILFK